MRGTAPTFACIRVVGGGGGHWGALLIRARLHPLDVAVVAVASPLVRVSFGALHVPARVRGVNTAPVVSLEKSQKKIQI